MTMSHWVLVPEALHVDANRLCAWVRRAHALAFSAPKRLPAPKAAPAPAPKRVAAPIKAKPKAKAKPKLKAKLASAKKKPARAKK
jgi:hypothetical protein